MRPGPRTIQLIIRACKSRNLGRNGPAACPSEGVPIAISASLCGRAPSIRAEDVLCARLSRVAARQPVACEYRESRGD